AGDWTLCGGPGLGARLLPEPVPRAPDGSPLITDPPLPPRLHPHAQRAVRRCPALALRLEKP
ncbi:ferredoxin, partial [Streptomyces sp. NRRL F-5755]|uniref:ferredoxin n=1 Tax=Streptomyces sp. NRRL F-5755 TaxID=1519475 RepID=UPI000AF17488